MRRLIIILLFLIASVWIGLEVVRHPGFLLVVYQPWTIEMPLWFALLTIVIIFFLFYLLLTCIDWFQFTWYRFKNWLHYRREHKSYSKTHRGLITLIEGRWAQAERLLVAGASQSIEPLVNYLGAAKAAHEQGAYDRRDSYLQKAHRVAPHAEIAIGLTKAELQFAEDHLEEAVATLNHVRQLAPRHPYMLKLLEKVYVRLSDWKNLLTLLPSLYKAKLLNAEQTEQFEKNIYCELFHAAELKGLGDLQRMWNDIPKRSRRNPEVVFAYVKQLQRFTDTTKEMEELIKKTLKKHWHPSLATLYGTLPFANTNRQLVIVGAWLNIYGQQPELLLTLGRLCVRAQLWGKARDYFERSLSLQAHAETYLVYGKLLEQLGDFDAAKEKYREGLSLLI